MTEFAEQPQLGIALGGGAALGYAHLGVLDAFEQAGLVPDLVAGTSMGAIAGASYLAWPSMSEVLRRFRVSLADPYVMDLDLGYLKGKADASLWESLFGRVRRGLLVTQSIVRDSIVDDESFSRILRNLLPDRRIEDLGKPFACVSANLSGRPPRYCWTSGPLLTAVAASSAIPGVFPAQRIGEDIHVDGGSVENIPVPTVRQMGASFAVAISVDDDKPRSKPGVAAEYFVAASHLAKETLTALQIEQADFVITPDLQGFHWADFEQLDEIVARGRVAAEKHLDEIRYLWQDHRKGFRKGIWSWFKKYSPF